jgi:hypothetical protein
MELDRLRRQTLIYCVFVFHFGADKRRRTRNEFVCPDAISRESFAGGIEKSYEHGRECRTIELGEAFVANGTGQDQRADNGSCGHDFLHMNFPCAAAVRRHTRSFGRLQQTLPSQTLTISRTLCDLE